ncbi:MAG: hypothetical protein AAFN43_00470 [Pseudomonadota bacterium]
MYSNDTFFHLTFPGQIGLALLSLGLACATLWCFVKISSRFGLFVKVLLAIVFLWLFTWLSPQVYYLYYLQLFDGLPLQNVIQMPPSPIDLVKIATFTENANLSAHAKGVLFWLMLAVSCWKSHTDRQP